MGSFIDVDDVHVYRAEPEGEVRGGVIVIHEIWGLVGHTRDVADRFAAQGYVTYAPDLLSEAGTTPEVGEELQAIIGDMDDEVRAREQPRLRAAFAPNGSPEFAARATKKLVKVLDALEQEPGVDGRLGVVGFCFGGSYAFELAVVDSRIRASVPFYGSPPTADKMGSIECPVFALYGEEDVNLVDDLPELKAGMEKAGVDFRVKVYDHAGHAFFNDQNERQGEPEAAADAWPRVLAFFDETLNPTAADTAAR
ncbi:MAG: dienelactone hydrolase family protein [Solirubrobacterales bacterium]